MDKSSIPCNLCGSEKRRFLFNKHGIEIVECENCGLAYVYPPISDNKVRKLYAEKEWNPTTGNVTDKSSKVRVAIFRMLKPDGKLRDIGCGYGRFLKEASFVYKTTGIDISPSKVKFGRENLHQDILY